MSTKDIPSDWSLPTLRSVSSLNPTRKDWPSDPLVSFFEMSQISEEGRMSNGVLRNMCSFSSGFTPFKNGDVILAKITPCFENGKGAFVENMPSGYGLGSTEFHVVRASADLDARFFFYLSNSYWFRKNGERNMTGSAGQKRVPTDWLKAIKIPLPPLSEQKKIAEILGACDEAIEAQERLIAQKQQRKKGLMQQLLTGKVRFPEFGGTARREVRLGDVGSVIGAGVDKKSNPEEVPVRLVNYMDVYRNPFITSGILDHTVTAPEKKAKQCSTKKGDVFFTPSSEKPTDIANSAVALEDIPDAVYSYHVVRLRLKEDWDLRFRAYAFTTDEFMRQAERICEGSGTRYVISLEDFRGIKVSVPSKEEQLAISSVLSACDEEIALQQNKLEQLKQQKKSLMQQLLTGKVRVKV